jgi:poly(A) polymerase Pap1
MYIYSHFKHVSGVPAPEGTHGVTISKLKILDSLIEQLGRLKNRGSFELEAEGKTGDRLDALISQYEQQLRQAQAAGAAMPYSAVSQVATGAVFNLVA